ncbi:MAG TPA: hypothetical protein VH600_13950 [Burkholderiales bacterium]|jgi:hypothetical protein
MRVILIVTCLLAGGCVLVEQRKADAPLGPHEVRSAQRASDALAIGKSTKADVRAALGEAVVVDFDSGYAVWVYKEPPKEKAQPPATELVLLFDRSGTLARTRIR